MKLKLGDNINEIAYRYDFATVESCEETLNSEKYTLLAQRASDNYKFVITIGYDKIKKTWLVLQGTIVGGEYWEPVKEKPKVIGKSTARDVKIFNDIDPRDDY